MNDEKPPLTPAWDLATVTKELESAFANNSENELLRILRSNSFLFYELFSRKWGAQPVFHEISFGGNLRCDFAWLNDNSDGPEWVLVEVEKPRMQLFTKQNEPSKHLHHALEQVKSWRRYFSENSAEKKRIFGAAAKFRYIIIAGDSQDWSHESAAKWRIDHNKSSEFEIRSSDVFLRSLKILEHKPEELWSFAEKPRTLLPSKLQQYWEEYGYMDLWRKILL